MSDDPELATSMSLINDAVANDQVAWVKLTETYGPLVYYWCRKLSVSPEDSADVFQDVFRSLAKNLTNFRKEKEGDRFRAYLWTITRNKIRDLVKVQNGKALASGGTSAQIQVQEIPDLQSTCTSQVIELSKFVRDALLKIEPEFKPTTWQMFWRVVVDDQSPTLVAEQLNVKLDSVYQAKSRVLKRLRSELSDVPI